MKSMGPVLQSDIHPKDFQPGWGLLWAGIADPDFPIPIYTNCCPFVIHCKIQYLHWDLHLPVETLCLSVVSWSKSSTPFDQVYEEAEICFLSRGVKLVKLSWIRSDIFYHWLQHYLGIRPLVVYLQQTNREMKERKKSWSTEIVTALKGWFNC